MQTTLTPYFRKAPVYPNLAAMEAPAMPDRLHPESVAAIGDRIRLTREAMKLTQAAFARLVRTDPQAINNWEAARSRISLDQALKVCHATGVGLNWIYRGQISDMPMNLTMAVQKLTAEASRRR